MGMQDPAESQSPRGAPKKRISPASDESEDGPLIEGEGKYGKRYKVCSGLMRQLSRIWGTLLVGACTAAHAALWACKNSDVLSKPALAAQWSLLDAQSKTCPSSELLVNLTKRLVVFC